MAIEIDRLQQFMGKMVQDAGAASSAPLVLVGDKLGLYKAMAGAGPLTAEELARRTETDPRYVREWLCCQAASGYVDYHPHLSSFELNDEQRLAFADEDSPVFLPGMFEVIASSFRDEPKITQAFKTGQGVGWHEHDSCLFSGTARFFKSGYQAHLVQDWLPALDGVTEKLERGARVADVGCGHGISTLLMAKAFPASTFHGFDYHPDSIRSAREAAKREGLEDRVHFEVAPAKLFPGEGYDLVVILDALHDMGDPVGAAAHVREALAEDGSWMIVEPYANDRLEDNLNPVGRIYYAASTMICTPASRSQEVGLALGAQAGEARIREVVTQGGFTRFQRATETPFNLVFEARP